MPIIPREPELKFAACDTAESVDAMWTDPGKGHLRRNKEV